MNWVKNVQPYLLKYVVYFKTTNTNIVNMRCDAFKIYLKNVT